MGEILSRVESLRSADAGPAGRVVLNQCTLSAPSAVVRPDDPGAMVRRPDRSQPFLFSPQDIQLASAKRGLPENGLRPLLARVWEGGSVPTSRLWTTSAIAFPLPLTYSSD